jgi:HD-GYP domain-containing protein (c-di-GMP phosphodiesterase class II)
MRIRLVQSLKGGERLAEPVITEKKEILISKGAELKLEYLDMLSFLGIDTVSIEDPYKGYETANHIINDEKKNNYIEEVRDILEKHIYQGKATLEGIEALARKIIDDLDDFDDGKVIDVAERNGNLYDHTVFVTLLTILVAKKLDIKDENLCEIAQGALLHDLGLRYITVPYVNCDMERRTSAETFEYHKHTILAYSALENEKWLSPVAKNMILTHHERKDGSGFPLKQKTKDIESKILQACDAFDCLISGMECKRVKIEEAMEYIGEVADVLFDANIIKVIEKMIARYPVGTKVRLSTGENAVVLKQTSDSIKPIVGVLDENEQMTDQRYSLNEDKDIAVLWVYD